MHVLKKICKYINHVDEPKTCTVVTIKVICKGKDEDWVYVDDVEKRITWLAEKERKKDRILHAIGDKIKAIYGDKFDKFVLAKMSHEECCKKVNMNHSTDNKEILLRTLLTKQVICKKFTYGVQPTPWTKMFDYKHESHCYVFELDAEKLKQGVITLGKAVSFRSSSQAQQTQTQHEQEQEQELRRRQQERDLEEQRQRQKERERKERLPEGPEREQYLREKEQQERFRQEQSLVGEEREQLWEKRRQEEEKRQQGGSNEYEKRKKNRKSGGNYY